MDKSNCEKEFLKMIIWKKYLTCAIDLSNTSNQSLLMRSSTQQQQTLEFISISSVSRNSFQLTLDSVCLLSYPVDIFILNSIHNKNFTRSTYLDYLAS